MLFSHPGLPLGTFLQTATGRAVSHKPAGSDADKIAVTVLTKLPPLRGSDCTHGAVRRHRHGALFAAIPRTPIFHPRVRTISVSIESSVALPAGWGGSAGDPVLLDSARPRSMPGPAAQLSSAVVPLSSRPPLRPSPVGHRPAVRKPSLGDAPARLPAQACTMPHSSARDDSAVGSGGGGRLPRRVW